MRKCSQDIRKLREEWLSRNPSNDSSASLAAELSDFLDDLSDEIEACFEA
jgi:hypothetical protein